MKTATGTKQATPTYDAPARRESAAPTPPDSLVRLVASPPARSSAPPPRSSVPPPLPAPARASSMPPAASSRPPRGSLPPVLPPPRKLAMRDDGEPTVHDARVAALAVRETLVQIQQSLEALHRRVDEIERRHERASLASVAPAAIAVADSAPLGLDVAIDGARRRRRTIGVMLFAVLLAAGALVGSLAASHP